MMRPTWCQSVH